jgi:hypothetical protein
MAVERISATRFRVSINVSREEQERRRLAHDIRLDLEREAAQPFEFEPRPVVAPRARGKPVSRETVERLTELLAEAAYASGDPILKPRSGDRSLVST